MTRSETAAKICRRRRQCLVHRYLYYVKCEPLIDDFAYDLLERDLRTLVEENAELAASLLYADDCPTKSVGSSNLSGYPREMQCVAESLLAYAKSTKEAGRVAPIPDLLNVEEPVPYSETRNEQPGLFGR